MGTVRGERQKMGTDSCPTSTRRRTRKMVGDEEREQYTVCTVRILAASIAHGVMRLELVVPNLCGRVVEAENLTTNTTTKRSKQRPTHVVTLGSRATAIAGLHAHTDPTTPSRRYT